MFPCQRAAIKCCFPKMMTKSLITAICKIYDTAQKMKFSTKYFFSKYGQICRKLHFPDSVKFSNKESMLKSSSDNFLWFYLYVHNNFGTPDIFLFSSFLSFYKNNTKQLLLSVLFFVFFSCYHVAVDTKPCWRRHRRMFVKESNGKYLFCHKSRLRWYSSSKFRPSLLCISCFASHGFRFFDWFWLEII